jgi:hypothetical protein
MSSPRRWRLLDGNMRLSAIVMISLSAGCPRGPGGEVISGPAARVQPESGVSGGTPDQRASVEESVRAAEAVYANPAFRQLLADRDYWLRAVEDGQTYDGRPVPAILTGSDVASLLSDVRPSEGSYQIVGRLRWYSVWQLADSGTIAETSVCGGIRLLRVNVSDAPSYVDTIAHENTHRVGRGSGRLRCDSDGSHLYQFEDDGHDRATRAWLVSYVVGDIAQCFHNGNGDPTATRRCFDDVTTRDGACRRYDECCVYSKWTVIDEVRRRSARCVEARTVSACESLERVCGR